MAKLPSNQPNRSPFTALGYSVALNSVMILLGTIGNAFHPLFFLKWISSAIGWPAGLIVKMVFHPNVTSFETFAVAAIEGLAISIVFYTLIAWLALWLWPSNRA